MIRLIKADFYRLLRTKGFYITMVLMVAYAALIVTSQSVGSVGVNVEDTLDAAAIQWNLKMAVQYASFSSAFLVYFLIGLFVILFGYEFSQRTYKNSLTAGVTRLTFVFSKYLIQLLFFFIATILYFGGAVVVAANKYGLGDTDLVPFLWNTLVLSLGVSLIISVIFSLASLILVSTNSLVLSSVFVVIYPLAIQIVAMMTEFDGLKYFDFFGLVQQIGVGALTINELLPYAAVSLIVIVLSLVGSSLVIRQKEL
ncbi:ABC transporter permease [uncultured Enterococcus sp.]|uniref:ABC transporter permease n=1 Tax=uncultured Enterococcus sp. TaxID=167972 RepID=UPI002AA7DE6C|nr:ABC transporter permease [uncultured Enterococcus sp.]